VKDLESKNNMFYSFENKYEIQFKKAQDEIEILIKKLENVLSKNTKERQKWENALLEMNSKLKNIDIDKINLTGINQINSPKIANINEFDSIDEFANN